jgi:hypothetical protein
MRPALSSMRCEALSSRPSTAVAACQRILVNEWMHGMLRNGLVNLWGQGLGHIACGRAGCRVAAAPHLLLCCIPTAGPSTQPKQAPRTRRRALATGPRSSSSGTVPAPLPPRSGRLGRRGEERKEEARPWQGGAAARQGRRRQGRQARARRRRRQRHAVGRGVGGRRGRGGGGIFGAQWAASVLNGSGDEEELASLLVLFDLPLSHMKPPALQTPTQPHQAPYMDSVLKVYCIHTEPNYSMPWQRKRQYPSNSSGFVVAAGDSRWILTNAHSVDYQTQVKVKRRGDDRKFLARVLSVGVDCDIALLTGEGGWGVGVGGGFGIVYPSCWPAGAHPSPPPHTAVDDPEFWDGVVALEFGNLPRLQDQVGLDPAAASSPRHSASRLCPQTPTDARETSNQPSHRPTPRNQPTAL